MRAFSARSRLAVSLVVAPLAAAAGCASAPRTPGPIVDPTAGTRTTTRVVGANNEAVELQAISSPVATAYESLAAPAEKAYAALAGVYQALGIPVNTVQTDAGLLGARDARVPRRLGDVELGRYVNCGIHASGAPNVELYAVTMTVLSRVTPDAAGTASNVTTQLVATARPVSTSGNPVRCSSTGRLENAINKRLALDSVR